MVGHPSPKVRSVFYRVLPNLKTSEWVNYIDAIIQEKNPLVKFFGCRAIINLASEEQIQSYLDDERFGMLEKSVFDAKLFSKYPFNPKWIESLDDLERDLIDQGSLLAIFDSDFIYLSTGWDLNRSFFSLIDKFVT